MSYNLVDPTTGDLTRVAGGIDTSIIPSNASASNKLVTHQVPYELFTLNNNSGSQKWYKLGKYEEGNYTARLDFVSARVDGQMFESSVRLSGIGNDNNYVSWIGEKGCEISTIEVKADSARNLYIKMNSYSAVEIRVYGTFTLDIVEHSSEPSGIQIVLNTLVTMDKVAHEVDTSYMSNGVVNVSSIRQSLGAGCYEIMGQGSSGHGSIRLDIWQVVSGTFAFSCCITDTSGVRSICSNDGESPTVGVGTSYFNITNKIIKIF